VLSYIAAPGEANDLSITLEPDGTFDVVDTGALVLEGAGCGAITETEAMCFPPAGAVVSVDLGDGDDTATVNGPRATVLGGPGDDVITAASFGAGPGDTLDGGPGNDQLTGGPGDDALIGGPGNDTLRGLGGDDSLSGDDDPLVGPGPFVMPAGGPAATGDDILDGGDGRDTVSYLARTEPVTVNLGQGSPAGQAGERDRLFGVEDVLGGSGDDVLIGNGAGNLLSGGAGDDHIDGAAGDDVVDGGPGLDAVHGGPGDDRIATGGESVASGDCGPGTDAVVAPRARTTTFGTDCERVLTSDGGGAALITARPAALRAGFLLVDAACPSTVASCALALRFSTAAGGLGAGTLHLGAGQAGQMRVRVPPALVARLRPGSRQTLVVASAAAGDPLGWSTPWFVPGAR